MFNFFPKFYEKSDYTARTWAIHYKICSSLFVKDNWNALYDFFLFSLCLTHKTTFLLADLCGFGSFHNMKLLNNFKLFSNFNEVQDYSLMMIC